MIGALRTFLFTDMASSTQLLDELGEEAFEEVRRGHFALLREVLGTHAGQEVKSLGDGIMAVFESPTDAVACAVDLQRGVARAARLAPGRAVALRVGIHVGEAMTSDGDFFGMPVVAAKRLCDAARPGQVLASTLVEALAGARATHPVEDLGPLELKGISTPLAACEVLWEAPEGDQLPLPPALEREGPTTFVGRGATLSRLHALLDEVRGGALRVAALAGEPGIGKSRLAQQLAREAHVAGATALLGRCHEDGLVPYQPFVDAMRHCARVAPAEDLRAWAGRHGAELARLAPDLHDRLPGVPRPVPGAPDGERHRLFEAIRHALGALAAARPVVLVLDDLQWADAPTLLLLRHLARADDAGRVLVVCTYRTAEVGAGHALSALLADLERDGTAERLTVGGLQDEPLRALMRECAGRDLPPALVQTVARQTEGNPFFVQQVVGHLRDSGLMAGGSMASGTVREAGVPAGVRALIGRRLAKLGRSTVEVLGAAAVLGRSFRPACLEELECLTGHDVLGALEEGLAAGLVEEAAGPAGRLRFTHALVRETLHEELSSVRRARLHLQAGEALERATPAPEGSALAELAYHFCEAAQVADPEKAVDYAVRAARWATAQTAYEEAAEHLRRALDALDLLEEPPQRRRCALLLDLGEALWRADHTHEAFDVFRQAAILADRLGEPDLHAQAGRVAVGAV